MPENTSPNGQPPPYSFSAFGPFKHGDGSFEYEVYVVNLTGVTPQVCARAHIRGTDAEAARILMAAIAKVNEALPAPLITRV